MSTFRDAIWQTLHETWADDEPLPMHADAVLAMPEMEAIRKALACFWTHESNCYCGADALDSQQAIVQWVETAPSAHVLGGDQ